MPKRKRRKSTRLETMLRNAVISSCRPRMSFSVRGENEPEPEVEGRASLKLRGALIEPIRDVHEVVFKLWPDPDKRMGPARPAAVGYIVAVRPAVEVIANFKPADFHYIWSLALSGHLTYAYMNFTKTSLRLGVSVEFVVLEPVRGVVAARRSILGSWAFSRFAVHRAA